jgi:hypothetical protein
LAAKEYTGVTMMNNEIWLRLMPEIHGPVRYYVLFDQLLSGTRFMSTTPMINVGIKMMLAKTTR